MNLGLIRRNRKRRSFTFRYNKAQTALHCSPVALLLIGSLPRLEFYERSAGLIGVVCQNVVTRTVAED